MAGQRTLFVDTETYSATDIKSAGSYKYMEDPAFEILLLPYAWDDEPVRVLDLTDPADMEELPDILAGLKDPDIIKVAHNTPFERNAYRRQFGFYQPPEEWVDTLVLCAMNGLPLSLDAAGAALNLEQQKLKEGKALINYFCKPCRATIANGGRTRNLPHHAPERWARFKEYAKRDVETMRLIYKLLHRFPVTPFERRLWALDARINERGVKVDVELAEAAMAVDEAFREEHVAEMKKLTGFDNPNSVAQLKEWLEMVGVSCESLNKASVADLRGEVTDPTTRRVLELRQMLGKTAAKKYETMTAAACSDHRVRGILQYYGAARTGRWAGRLLQPQNMAQNHIDHIDEVREIVRARDLETLELLYDNVPDVLGQLTRTAIVAKEGHTFLVADYSAIEARVIAYLAGEQWIMDTFAEGKDLYCATASKMFKVPVEKHGINGHLRQKGKVATLACGYGGGVAALKAFGADKMGLTEPEMQEIVTQWRLASPTIPRLWRRVEDAAKAALENPGRRCVVMRKYRDVERARQNEALTGRSGYSLDFNAGGTVCTYWRDKDALRCKLPSGRILTYWGARLNSEGGIVFMGQNQTTRKWEETETWGGKLVENCWGAGTLILTDKGPKPIEQITASDLIWDGVEWVHHEGVIDQGVHDTVELNGCRVTPDHKILTTEGWKNAETCDGLEGVPVRNPRNYRYITSNTKRRSPLLDRTMRLRKSTRRRYTRHQEGALLRMPDALDYKCETEDTRQKSPSRLCGVAVADPAMHQPLAQGMEELRRAGHHCVRTLAEKLRELLVGYGCNVSARTGHRQDRQQSGVLSRELPLDDAEGELQKPTQQRRHRHTLRAHDIGRTLGEDWHWKNDFTLPTEAWCACRLSVQPARRSEQVFDIRNCGPRHRYTVLTAKGPIIAHNCVQSFARDCLAEALVRLDEAGFATVFHVHDEVVAEEPKDGRTYKDMAEVMGRSIEWAPGLLLRADGYETEWYRKD